MKTIKKLTALLLATILAFFSMAVIASAEGESYLTFSKSGSYYVVDSCSARASGVITVPATYDGLPVTKIADNAFQSCSGITQVVLPESISSVGKYAFADCGSLTAISFNSETCSIGTAAFSGCDRLVTVNLPSKIGAIPNEAFKSCTSLTEIFLPSTVVAIGKEAFMNTGLTRATVPASTISIGENAFMSCPAIEYFAVDSANTSFKAIDGCLYTADGKTLIQYPAGSAETSYTVASTATTVGNGAFSESQNLTKVILPSALTEIKPYAFYNCSALTSVNIPEGVTIIGSMAFSGCSALSAVTIPSSVVSFENAFVKSGLQSVVFADGVEEISAKAFANCENLTSVTIPSSVTAIGVGSFDGCTALESITIPATVTAIGSGAFNGCSGIKLIVEKDSAAYNYAVSNSLSYSLDSGSAAPVISSVSIKTKPSKLTYTVGESVNTSGLVLKVSYSDGTSKEVTSGFTVSPATLTSEGTKTITVTYGGKSTAYQVTVKAAASGEEKTAVSIEVAELPVKTQYNYRDAVDITGLVIKVNYSDGTSEEITSGFITDAPSQLKPVGERVITVTYGELTTTFTVTSSYAWWQQLIRILLLGFLWY